MQTTAVVGLKFLWYHKLYINHVWRYYMTSNEYMISLHYEIISLHYEIKDQSVYYNFEMVVNMWAKE